MLLTSVGSRVLAVVLIASFPGPISLLDGLQDVARYLHEAVRLVPQVDRPRICPIEDFLLILGNLGEIPSAKQCRDIL